MYKSTDNYTGEYQVFQISDMQYDLPVLEKFFKTVSCVCAVFECIVDKLPHQG